MKVTSEPWLMLIERHAEKRSEIILRYCEGSSDKEYRLKICQDKGDKSLYYLVAEWGRRTNVCNKVLKSQGSHIQMKKQGQSARVILTRE